MGLGSAGLILLDQHRCSVLSDPPDPWLQSQDPGLKTIPSPSTSSQEAWGNSGAHYPHGCRHSILNPSLGQLFNGYSNHHFQRYPLILRWEYGFLQSKSWVRAEVGWRPKISYFQPENLFHDSWDQSPLVIVITSKVIYIFNLLPSKTVQ